MASHEFYAPTKDFESTSQVGRNFQHTGLGTTLQEYYGPNQQGSVPGIATGFHGLAFDTGFDPENFKNLYGHSSPVVAIAFSPDGNLIAAGSRAGELRMWSIMGKTPRTDFTGHTGTVAAVTFSADGVLLASGSADQTIRLWNPKYGKIFQILKGHTDTITALKFSPSGQLLVSGSEDRTIRVWDITSGSYRVVSGQKPLLVAIGFSSNGETAILSSHGDKPTLRLIDLVDPSNRFLPNLGAIAHSVALSPDGNVVAAGLGDNTVQYWDITKDESYVLVGHQAPVFAITCSNDNKFIVSGSADGTVRIWNKEEVQNHLIMSTEAKVWAVSFPQDGTMLAVGLGNGIIRVFGRATRGNTGTGKSLKGVVKSLFKGRERSNPTSSNQ